MIEALLIVLGSVATAATLFVYFLMKHIGSWTRPPGKGFWLVPPMRVYVPLGGGLSRTSLCWLANVHYASSSASAWTICTHMGCGVRREDLRHIWNRIERRVYRRFHRAGYSLDMPKEVGYDG